jgi:hypothetical protein
MHFREIDGVAPLRIRSSIGSQDATAGDTQRAVQSSSLPSAVEQSLSVAQGITNIAAQNETFKALLPIVVKGSNAPTLGRPAVSIRPRPPAPSSPSALIQAPSTNAAKNSGLSSEMVITTPLLSKLHPNEDNGVQAPLATSIVSKEHDAVSKGRTNLSNTDLALNQTGGGTKARSSLSSRPTVTPNDSVAKVFNQLGLAYMFRAIKTCVDIGNADCGLLAESETTKEDCSGYERTQKAT